ncbi:MAG: protein translocase subunit SecD [Acidimicrobiaceae bacterium]|nr:protein translocase subunit SecD [Acidimicrobiaceae bacterium]
MRRQVTYVVLIVLLSVGGIIYTLAAGNEPFLGLDLQGGASVVLEPAEPADGTEIDEDTLDQAVEIIRNRVDGLGVREPEVTRQGATILVQIPGVEDEARAIDLVGQTAELRFRPVLADGMLGVPFSESALASCPNASELLAAAPTPDAAADECMIGSDKRNDAVAYLLGPAPELLQQDGDGVDRLNGESLETAAALFQVPEWIVSITFRPGSPGIDDFNNLASMCASGSPGCPPTGIDRSSGRGVGRLAIEIDGVVESAPNVAVANFSRDGIVISGGNMQEEEAKDLALVLRFGALPLELIPQESRIVSSTLGEDALDSGVIAAIIGVGMVSIYLIAYYRLLGVVAILSLVISGSLLWTIIAWLGETQGLALTLAGVTGLIVSIGVSVDSNVVYFEHLKEDVRNDRSLRSAVERAFPIAYSTIVKANVASLIAAAVLYFLTVGQVKGFALFLGLATVLDLVATYFFMGPAIRILAARDGVEEKPSRFGIPSPAEVSS